MAEEEGEDEDEPLLTSGGFENLWSSWGHNARVWDATFSTRGRIVTASEDGTLRVWDAAGKCLSALQGHAGRHVWSLAANPAASREGTPCWQIASGGGDSTVKLWDVHGGGKCYSTLQGHSDPIYSIAFSPSGEYLVSGSIDNSLMIWSVKDGALLKRYRGAGEIFEVSWNQEGDKVAACFSDSTVAIIDFRKL